METQTDDLAALLDALQIKKAHIAGISFGGEVARAFALKYSHKTCILLLMDTVSEISPEIRLIVQSWMDALRTGDPRVFFNSTVAWNYSTEIITRKCALLESA